MPPSAPGSDLPLVRPEGRWAPEVADLLGADRAAFESTQDLSVVTASGSTPAADRLVIGPAVPVQAAAPDSKPGLRARRRPATEDSGGQTSWVVDDTAVSTS